MKNVLKTIITLCLIVALMHPLDIYAAEDETQLTVTEGETEIGVPVVANAPNSIYVSVPKITNLRVQNKVATGTCELRITGDTGSNVSITVYNTSTFSLTQGTKTPITATVVAKDVKSNQIITSTSGSYTYKTYTGDEVSVGQAIQYEISASGVTAGKWSGNIGFKVKVTSSN